jgi:vancomycin resistance protein YoaR
MSLSGNRKLEELFDLPPAPDDAQDQQAELPTTATDLIKIDETIDKIEAALPQVRGLESTDREMDELADLAVTGYKDLTDLGMQVDSRFAAEIFSVASNMLGHAITAKTAKLDKKLKMIDLQLKKARLDQQSGDDAATPQAQGMVLNRNELLDRIMQATRETPEKNK